MSEYVLTSEELDTAHNALLRILEQPVDQIELTDAIPPTDDIPDSNRVFHGKLSILFVDIRKSTELTDQLAAKTMVKLYRAYTRMVIQAIRYAGGHTRQFAGDGVMGVFQDSIESKQCYTSSQKAVNAARYIQTLIDFYLNPELSAKFNTLRIGCGIGICTGTITITKVGMRGKESDAASDNETGVVWVGSATNYANRLCNLAGPSEIFIDQNTYSEIAINDAWSPVSRTKGSHVFDGYIAQDYYLPLPNGIVRTAAKSENLSNAIDSFVQRIFSEMQCNALQFVDALRQQTAELAVELEQIKKQQQDLSDRDKKLQQLKKQLDTLQQKLDAKQNHLDDRENQLARDHYCFYKDIISSAHCKRDFIIGMGKAFWDEKLEQLIKCGIDIGLTAKQARCEVCYTLVSIYSNLDDYEAAYDALCLQAETHSWIHAFTVESVLKHTYLHSHLRDIIEARLKTDIDPQLRKSLLECLAKIPS